MESIKDYIIPQNLEAEKSVLSACLLNEVAIEELAVKLDSSDFTKKEHMIIFDSIIDLYKRNIEIDMLSVADNLKAKGQLEEIGDRDYLLDLTNNVIALTNWRTHSDIIKRNSVLGNLQNAASKISTLTFDAPDDLNQIVEEAEKYVFEATDKKTTSGFRRLDELLVDTFFELNELSKNKDKTIGLQTGFIDLDHDLNGLLGGNLVILAARPGVGKTSFALNIALNAAKQGIKVAFMSLEMSDSELVQRVLSSESKVDLKSIRSAKLNDNELKSVVKTSDDLSKLDFYIDDTPGLSIFELRAKARRELRGVKNGLIIVDYLQLMQASASKKNRSRNDVVAEISRGLKILAKELDTPILALSQLSRNIEQRANGKNRPMLSDLRDSGAIEQDADIVLFIDRSLSKEESEDENRPNWGEAVVSIAKNRNGATGHHLLSFDPETTTFFNNYKER